MTTTAAAIRRDGAASKMLLGIYLVLVFFVMLLSPVSDTGSDSYGELLVSQVILHDHTVQLDRYKDYFRLADGRMHHAIVESGGHLYDLFPLGTSIVSLPAVAAANAAGIDVREA
ncbi:MAG TPA: hypothetical protein VG672_09175, partial [Bryobacteraceae bacterium]|nr:hypothetical protein [Bryobacteraceae bacterium]